jgi:hypothetical protein
MTRLAGIQHCMWRKMLLLLVTSPNHKRATHEMLLTWMTRLRYNQDCFQYSITSCLHANNIEVLSSGVHTLGMQLRTSIEVITTTRVMLASEHGPGHHGRDTHMICYPPELCRTATIMDTAFPIKFYLEHIHHKNSELHSASYRIGLWPLY